jgi:hypothetical protein
MPELRIIIPERLERKIADHQPDYLDRKGFVCLILDQALDGGCRLPAYRVGAGTTGQVTRQLTPQQPSPLTGEVQASLAVEAVQAVESSAQKIEPPRESTVGNRKKTRAKRTKGCDSFETFWATYQSIPHALKASNQNKAKALEVWNQLVPEQVSADDLQTAADRLSKAAIQNDESSTYMTCQPDCFRWLRDDGYSVWLEQNEPAAYVPTYTIL